jgi:hypothetical protein
MGASNRRSTSGWSPLTRQRPHRLIDLLLGILLVTPVVFWIGSISTLLAAVIFIAVAGLYLANLSRGGRGRGRRDAAISVSPVDQDGNPIAALDELLAAAPPIPLTDWVRVDVGAVTPLVDEVRAAAIELGHADQAEELSRVVLEGRPVPFTDELRIDRRRAQRILQALRSS